MHEISPSNHEYGQHRLVPLAALTPASSPSDISRALSYEALQRANVPDLVNTLTLCLDHRSLATSFSELAHAFFEELSPDAIAVQRRLIAASTDVLRDFQQSLSSSLFLPTERLLNHCEEIAACLVALPHRDQFEEIASLFHEFFSLATDIAIASRSPGGSKGESEAWQEFHGRTLDLIVGAVIHHVNDGSHNNGAIHDDILTYTRILLADERIFDGLAHFDHFDVKYWLNVIQLAANASSAHLSPMLGTVTEHLLDLQPNFEREFAVEQSYNNLLTMALRALRSVGNSPRNQELFARALKQTSHQSDSWNQAFLGLSTFSLSDTWSEVKPIILMSLDSYTQALVTLLEYLDIEGAEQIVSIELSHLSSDKKLARQVLASLQELLLDDELACLSLDGTQYQKSRQHSQTQRDVVLRLLDKFES